VKETPVMPLLQWDAVDLIEYLEVEPVNTEDEVQHAFEVRRDGVCLRLTIWQYESVAQIALGLESAPLPLIELALFVREKVSVQRYQGQEWLEFRDCVLTNSRFAYLEMGNVFDRVRYPYGQPIRVWMRPQLRIELVRG
jgi:hypothetical protein